jgi:RNA polymerase sigma-70 factor (ECF subfamily)
MAASTVPQERAGINLSDWELGELRSRIRYKVCYDVGFYCPDVDDIVQETFKRLLAADAARKIQNPAAIGAFVNGICRNVICEFRRKAMRNERMPEMMSESPARALLESDLFELRQAIAHGLDQLSERDRKVLRAFYLEETPREEILRHMGMTDDNFRVVLFRAKERFRAIYTQPAKQPEGSGH